MSKPTPPSQPPQGGLSDLSTGQPVATVPGGIVRPGGERELPGLVPRPRSPRIDPLLTPVKPGR